MMYAIQRKEKRKKEKTVRCSSSIIRHQKNKNDAIPLPQGRCRIQTTRKNDVMCYPQMIILEFLKCGRFINMLHYQNSALYDQKIEFIIFF